MARSCCQQVAAVGCSQHCVPSSGAAPQPRLRGAPLHTLCTARYRPPRPAPQADNSCLEDKRGLCVAGKIVACADGEPERQPRWQPGAPRPLLHGTRCPTLLGRSQRLGGIRTSRCALASGLPQPPDEPARAPRRPPLPAPGFACEGEAGAAACAATATPPPPDVPPVEACTEADFTCLSDTSEPFFKNFFYQTVSVA